MYTIDLLSEIAGESLDFINENGKILTLYTHHIQECCESHYMCSDDLSIKDFKNDLGEPLIFAFDDKTIRPIEGYGFELIPLNGHSI